MRLEHGQPKIFAQARWRSPDDLREQNDELLRALQRWNHRALGFVYLNPQHLDFSLREFDRCVRDLAGSDPPGGFTEMAVREVGAERVLYGSDSFGRSFASQLAKVKDANIPDEAKTLILGENLRRMMTPILKSKGVRV